MHFCLEAYRLTGIRPRLADRGFWSRFPKIPPCSAWTTLSGLSLRLDAVLVWRSSASGTNTRTFDLTAASAAWRHINAFQFFYLIMPLFRGTYESAGIFYFDFVRLRNAPAIRPLAIRFFHTLLWVAPVIALFYWLLAFALARFLLHGVPIGFLLALIPLFVVRSVIGIYQIRLFAEGRFGAHIATFLLLIALLWLVGEAESGLRSDRNHRRNAPPTHRLDQSAAPADRRDAPLPTLLSYGEWRQALAAEPGPVMVGTGAIPQAITSKQRSAVLA